MDPGGRRFMGYAEFAQDQRQREREQVQNPMLT